MVSTHQKYLCPDYLSPLTSAALDSNKSPLALLAQTCNSIGLPETPTTSSNGKSSSKISSSDGTPIKQESKSSNKEDSSKNNCKTSSSQADSTSDAGESSASTTVGKGKDSPEGKKSAVDGHKANSTTAEDGASSSSANGIGNSSAASDATPSTSSDPKPCNSSSSVSLPNGNAAAAMSAASMAAAKCGTCVTPAAYPPHLISHYFAAQPAAAAGAPAFLYGHGLATGIPFSSCYPGFAGAAAAAAAAAAMPSVATAGGAYPRLCMDPFCKSCPPNPAALMTPMNLAANPTAAGRPCPLGCTQCTSHPLDLSMWLNSYSSMLQNPAAGFHSAAMPSLASPNSAALAAAAAAAANNPFAGHYPTAANGSAAIPPVCWWNSGEGYCLKRFANAEELLQHLRTHAHESASKSSLLNQPLTGQLTTSSAGPGGRLSPRSTSYLNSINSLRYHPYSKLSPTAAAGIPGAVSSFPNIPFPTLNPAATYGLPSSLYSGPPRLPGSLPHP